METVEQDIFFSRKVQDHLRENWWKYLVLLIYMILVLIAVVYHEPFTDEGQSWLIARDASPQMIVFKYVRYESHPCLWYLLLMIPAKLNLPYVTISFISIIIASVTAYLIIFKSPFPAYIKILMVFSYFFFYQYAVVARLYTLATLLLIMLAIMYKDRLKRPYIFTVLLCLLANVTLPATLIALGIFFVQVIEVFRDWKILDKPTRKRAVTAACIFFANLAFVIIQMWPAQDYSLKVVPVISASRFWDVFVNYFLRGCINNYWYITVPVLAISLIWFKRRKVLLLYLLPTGLHLIFISLIPASIFNQGLFMIEWVFALWVSFQNKEELEPEREKRFKGWRLNLYYMTIAAMVIVLCFQVYWSAYAFTTDINNPYSGTYDVAEFIKANDLEDSTIYMVGGQSPTGVLPYFKENIYANYNNGEKPSFWFMSTTNKTPTELDEDAIATIKRDKPDLVILPFSATLCDSTEELEDKLDGTDYGIIMPFNSHMIWKDHSYIEPAYSYLILYNAKKFSL